MNIQILNNHGLLIQTEALNVVLDQTALLEIEDQIFTDEAIAVKTETGAEFTITMSPDETKFDGGIHGTVIVETCTFMTKLDEALA